MKILIGEISSYKAIVIAKHIKTKYSHFTILSYDFNKLVSSLKTRYVDKHSHIRIKNIDSYVIELAGLIKKINIDLFFPVHSDYIGEILKNKELFGNSLSYLGSFENYKKLHQKNILQSIAKKAGVNIPINFDSFESSKIPFIAKPVSGSSSKGVKYFLSEADRREFLNYDFSNYIFQEYIEGKGCGYSIYSVNGEIKTEYGHLRLAEYPVSGGSSVYRTTFYKEEMRMVAKKILEKVPWSGFAMFEFKLTPEGKLVLLEVNPRIWGSINQGLQNGVDFFEYIFNENNVHNIQVSNRIKTYLSPQIYISLILYILRGNFKPIIMFFRNIRHNRADVSLFDDPKGWLSLILRKIL